MDGTIIKMFMGLSYPLTNHSQVSVITMKFQNLNHYFRKCPIYNYPYPLICPEKKIIVFWMPKCGCTTLTKWFFDVCNFKVDLSGDIQALQMDEGELTHHIRGFYWYKCKRPSNLKKVYSDETYYRITVIRDPFSRLVSGYIDMMNSLIVGRMSEIEGIKINTDPEKMTFSDFVEILNHSNLYKCDPHLRLQSSNDCWQLNLTLDKIIILDQLNDGLLSVNKHLKCSANIKKLYAKPKTEYQGIKNLHTLAFKDISDMAKSRIPTTFPEYQQFYNDELREMVKSIYSEDFILFQRS